MLIKKKPSNVAGIMGRDASQPAQMTGVATVDPIERLSQRMAGRTMGGSMDGLKLRKPSIMSGYGKK